jgi:hypothetical protein
MAEYDEDGLELEDGFGPDDVDAEYGWIITNHPGKIEGSDLTGYQGPWNMSPEISQRLQRGEGRQFDLLSWRGESVVLTGRYIEPADQTQKDHSHEPLEKLSFYCGGTAIAYGEGDDRTVWPPPGPTYEPGELCGLGVDDGESHEPIRNVAAEVANRWVDQVRRDRVRCDELAYEMRETF